MKYYIRKKWDDESSQIGGEFTNLRDAAQKCPYGYTVFNESGSPLTGTLSINTDNTPKANYEEMWNKLKDIYINKLKNTEFDINTLDTPSVRKSVLIQFKWAYGEILRDIEKIEKEFTETIKIQGEEK